MAWRCMNGRAVIASRLGFHINAQSSGGGSDGNFTGAMGIPTLDGLGVAGAGAHTLDEHIQVDSLAYRGRADGRDSRNARLTGVGTIWRALRARFRLVVSAVVGAGRSAAAALRA